MAGCHPNPQFERRGAGWLVRAPAKLNLSLLIAGKRPDGFHEIETVMAKIDWYDELQVQSGSPGIELICNGPHWAPDGKDNLVYRAAAEVLRAAGQPDGVRLTLTKNIPAGSGLGGASSDAAATLMGLNRHFDLQLPPSELANIAAKLGSDVSFFLGGPLAFCTGRGEQVAPLADAFDFTALLILPDINVSTAEVYAQYTHDVREYERLSRLAGDYLAKGRIDLLSHIRANMLESSCYRVCDELRRLKDVAESLGVEPLCLSGSGSTLYMLVYDADLEGLDPLRARIASETGCCSVVVRNNPW
jgi:4-diphosphocytidyl-2-C-methyl-D-erythritol kinase